MTSRWRVWWPMLLLVVATVGTGVYLALLRPPMTTTTAEHAALLETWAELPSLKRSTAGHRVAIERLSSQRGANAMMAMPVTATAAPIRSQRSGT